MRPHELWDLETGNAVDAFASEHKALEAVRDALATHGRDDVLPWGLADAATRQMRAVAQGEALIAGALAAGIAANERPTKRAVT